jgi:N-hydroxyarylamine O-acetyltransferase
VENDGDHWFVTCGEGASATGGRSDAPATYVFVLGPREFDEFHGVCNWLQTSPDSRFTHGSIVSLARPDGRATLAGGRLITMRDGERTVEDVTPEQEPAILEREFGIVL